MTIDTRHTIPVIYNPASKGGSSANKGAMLQALSPLIDLVPTGGPGDATNIAEGLVRSGARQIVAAGGDGTINEVIKGVLDADSERKVAFGVLPMGTANVFALELELPLNNLERCWQIIEKGDSRMVDVWSGNGKPFIQLAGIGFDAAVIDETSYEFKQLAGPMSYVLNAMRIFGESHETLTVEADTMDVPIDAAFVLVGNGKRYGGPMKFFPDAVNDDGLLDVVVFRKQELAVLLKFFHAITLGQIPKSGGDFFGFQCKKLQITSAHSVPFELDGELGGSTPLEIVHVGKLQVSVPRAKR